MITDPDGCAMIEAFYLCAMMENTEVKEYVVPFTPRGRRLAIEGM